MFCSCLFRPFFDPCTLFKGKFGRKVNTFFPHMQEKIVFFHSLSIFHIYVLECQSSTIPPKHIFDEVPVRLVLLAPYRGVTYVLKNDRGTCQPSEQYCPLGRMLSDIHPFSTLLALIYGTTSLPLRYVRGRLQTLCTFVVSLRQHQFNNYPLSLSIEGSQPKSANRLFFSLFSCICHKNIVPLHPVLESE